MLSLDEIHRDAEYLADKLRLRTYPLAIKLLKSEKEIPDEAIRPMKDMDVHLDLCQAFAMSRWTNKTVAMLKEDMWCFEPVVGFGLAEPPDAFLEGKNRYPASAMTPEAAREWVRRMPRLPVNKYIGVLSAPLNKCTFLPDVFIIYCDGAQLTHLMIAKNALDGKDIYAQISGHAGCVYYIVPVIKEKDFKVSSPCKGDRCYTRTQDTEIVFSGPVEKLSELVSAMKYLKGEWDFPWRLNLHPERSLHDNYAEIGAMMGMDLSRGLKGNRGIE